MEHVQTLVMILAYMVAIAPVQVPVGVIAIKYVLVAVVKNAKVLVRVHVKDHLEVVEQLQVEEAEFLQVVEKAPLRKLHHMKN